MNTTRARKILLLTAMIFAAGGVALLSGCKGNTTSAAMSEKSVPAPPTINAYCVSASPLEANPLTEGVWARGSWLPLVAPANTNRTTPPVRAAMLYDATTLYVAFVSETVPPPVAPIAQDSVSVYLDSTTSHEGTEMMQITVNPQGRASCTWIRSAEPAKAREDGSPDLNHPTSKIPDVAIKGLGARTTQTLQNGASVWTAVVAIPLKSLPIPLRQMPVAGGQWKINLLRTIITEDAGSGTQQLQANLSPVYLGAQSVSPYRMARLTLAR